MFTRVYASDHVTSPIVETLFRLLNLIPRRRVPLPTLTAPTTPSCQSVSIMPRKSAAATEGEPRRSTRIKDQPKPAAPAKKAPAKPRAKKAAAKAKAGQEEEEESAGEAKAKAGRGKKRSAAEVNGDDSGPPAKKVRLFVPSKWPHLIYMPISSSPSPLLNQLQRPPRSLLHQLRNLLQELGQRNPQARYYFLPRGGMLF